MDTEHTRRRRADGERSRRNILHTAARLATVEGLEGLSIGRLAEATGMSKSGLYAHFRSKQALQLATIDTAREIFIDAVVTPAMAAPPGPERLRALCEAFLGYVEERVFPGGCFFAGAAAEVGARPGPVRERIAHYQRQWMGLLERAATEAQAAGALERTVTPQRLAFEVNALLVAANNAFLLHDDPAVPDVAREAVRARLGGAAAGVPGAG